MPLDLSSEVAIRWNDCDAKFIPLLKEGGITTVILSSRNEDFEKACQEAGLKILAQEEIQFLSLETINRASPKTLVALTDGLWPGLGGSTDAKGAYTAGATEKPWVDSNGYWFAILRALYPNRPALLGYLPDDKAGVKPDSLLPYDSLELALVEARVNGGNYLLSLEPRYREKLLGGDAKALDAWRQLGRTARWLDKNASLFRQATFPIITVLVEPDAGVAEIVNLLFRQNASPALVNAANPPEPDPVHCLALAAVSIKPPSAEIQRRLLSHAEAGTSLIVNAPGANAWWRDPRLKLVRSQEGDRDFFSLGRGQVIAYRDQVSDPAAFAYDMIDIVTQKRRAARVWEGPTVIALATSCPPGASGGRALLHLINYGSQITEMLAGIQGSYSRASLLRPEAAPLSLPAATRGTLTEVMIPELGCVCDLVMG